MITTSSPSKKIGGGLLPLPIDERDFSHSVIFGSIARPLLPETEFYVSDPIGIKDQGNTDFCTAYASCAVSEDQEMVLLNPEYAFMKGKQLSGDPENWGQDLRVICKVHVKFGVIEQQYYPYLNRPAISRDELVDPKNWSEEDLAPLAYEHRKTSFFAVDGPYDTFDNFRMTLWKNKKEMRSILTGSLWYNAWTRAPKGIIPKEEQNEKGEGHAFKIFGQTIIDGEIYLAAQLSSGPDVGDHGIFYFPREVVNREFKFGAFTFKDMSRDVAQYHSENGISIKDGLLIKFIKVIRNLICRKK